MFTADLTRASEPTKGTEPSAEPPVRARADHVGIVVADLAAQQEWYGRVFGMAEVKADQPTPGTRTSLLRAPGGLQIELVESSGSRREHDSADAQQAALVQGYSHWAIDVNDLADAYET